MARKVGPSGKQSTAGKRVNIYLPLDSLAIAKDIDNLSEFFQVALRQAAGIMAFDIIKKQRGAEQPLPTQEQYDTFNQDHPLDPLTAKRLGKENKWPNTPPSAPKLENW